MKLLSSCLTYDFVGIDLFFHYTAVNDEANTSIHYLTQNWVERSFSQ